MTSAERELVERAKAASVGQLLLKAARLLNDRALEQVRERTGFAIRPSHTALFPHIDFQGTRLTDLAAKVGSSKQAVGQLVAELEQMGALERVPDPEDGRAKLIRFAKRRGRSSILDGLAVLAELETQFEDRLGTREVNRLRRTLALLVEHLDSTTDASRSND